MGESKIQIKVGIVEFSGEGNEGWLAEQFDKMLSKVPELLQIEVSAPNHNNLNKNSDSPTPTVNSNSDRLDLSIISIASKINDDSGPGLATAAAVYLRLVQQKPTFSREEILKVMKEAYGFYKDSYSGNLTKILQTLVKTNVLIQNAGQLYSVQINKERELNALFNN